MHYLLLRKNVDNVVILLYFLFQSVPHPGLHHRRIVSDSALPKYQKRKAPAPPPPPAEESHALKETAFGHMNEENDDNTDHWSLGEDDNIPAEHINPRGTKSKDLCSVI